jgi:hypothetical protein
MAAVAGDVASFLSVLQLSDTAFPSGRCSTSTLCGVPTSG